MNKKQLSVLDYLKSHPQSEQDQTKTAYFKRLSKLTGYSEASFKRSYYTTLEQIAEESNVDFSKVKHGWWKTDSVSLFFKNEQFDETISLDHIDWDTLINPTIRKALVLQEHRKGTFDRFVYTDVHIGMNPNPNGIGLYEKNWNEEELTKRLDRSIDIILKRQKSNVLVIDDLGDFMDGWEGKTLRKGHDLPQNMTNQEAFEVGLSFKIQMIELLYNHYDHIICHSVVNDNHSGDFGYVVNSAVRNYVEKVYPNVKFEIYKKFIEHYSIDDYTFLLSHGKDIDNRKHGFGIHLDKGSKDLIEDFINIHRLSVPNTKIEFSKGDSHQRLYDKATSIWFDYMNYPSFAPPSNWIMTNFSECQSGAFFCNYGKDGIEPFDIDF